MSAQACDVCGLPEYKYKCPACKAHSCSLPCFKQHKAACSAPPQQNIPSSISNPSIQEESAQEPSQVPSLNASDLQNLFQQYPSLKTHLQQIYLSTQEPSEPPGTDRPGKDGRPFVSRPWKPEKGFQLGLKSLQASLDRGGADAEGIAAFLKLVSERTKPET